MLKRCPFHLFKNKIVTKLSILKDIRDCVDDVGLVFGDCNYTLLLSRTFLVPFYYISEEGELRLKRLPHWYKRIENWSDNFIGKRLKDITNFDENYFHLKFSDALLLAANKHFVNIYDTHNECIFTTEEISINDG